VENDDVCKRAGYMAFKLDATKEEIKLATGLTDRNFDIALAFAYGYEEGRKDPDSLDD
jgi:hypothetical protein